MKKIYIIPATNVARVELPKMIATSIVVGQNYSGGTIESRGGDFWEDEGSAGGSVWGDDEDVDY